jgi:hypothetical protein
MKTLNKSESESEIEKYFIWAVASLGGKSFKFKSINHRGVADRVACLPDGSTWFVEIKRPKGGRLSPFQVIFAEEMAKLNQKYLVLNSKKEIDLWKLNLHKTN